VKLLVLKILNSVSLEEIIINVNMLKNYLENKIEKISYKKVNDDIFRICQEYIEDYNNNQNISDYITIYSNKKVLGIQFAFEILNLQKWEDIIECLNYLLNDYYPLLSKCKEKSLGISENDIIETFELMQNRYNLKDIIDLSKVKVNIFFINNYCCREENNIGIELINHSIISNKSFSIFIYKIKENVIFDVEEMLYTHLITLAQNIICGKSLKVPDSFIKLCDRLSINIDGESTEAIKLFSNLFYYINTFDESESEVTENISLIKEYYHTLLNDYYISVLNKSKEIEYPKTQLCPCGSGKKYGVCCFKKKIIYTKNEMGEIKRVYELGEEIEDILIENDLKFKKLYGRVLGDNDMIGLGHLDNDFYRHKRNFKYNNIEMSPILYAYDRTGIIVTEFNKKNIPENRIHEYNKKIVEYNKLMKQKIKKGKVNLLQAAELSNLALKKMCDTYLDNLVTTFSIVINDITKSDTIPSSFKINGLNDYLVFCIYKIIQNLQALKVLIEEGFTQSSILTVRLIYEILISIKAYINDEELFENKIIPLAGIEKGTHYEKNKSIVIEKKTGKELNCYISIEKIAKKAGFLYEKLYKTLYKDYSTFIHVDALGAKKLFSENDLFTDVDSCYITGYIAIIFCVDILFELSKYKSISIAVKNDIKYFSNNLALYLEELHKTIKSIYEDQEVYCILEDIIKEYNINLNVNKNRDKRVDYF